MRIGISGGTFDPIHYGHLVTAEEIREAEGLDSIIFIPTGMPPHKDNKRVTSTYHRFNMVKAAVESNPFFQVSGMEINRPGYTYTIDTLRQLRARYQPETKLFFIIGADVVHELTTWKEYRKVFSMCEFIAAVRPGYPRESLDEEIEKLRVNYSAMIHTVETTLLGVSSTKIRERVSKGKSIKYLVPEKVEEYIIDNRLYRL